VGPFGSTTRDRCVDTQQGGAKGVASAGIGSGAGSNLQHIISSQDRDFDKDLVHLLRPEHKRFQKVGAGVYEVVFEKKAPLLALHAQPVLAPPFAETQRHLYQALIDRHISHEDAVTFLTSPDYPDKMIQEKIEVHDWLVERGDPRISKSASGYLVMSIRKRYSQPEGFTTTAERLAAQTKVREQEAERAEQERLRRERERARYDSDVQKVCDYLASLPNDAAREDLEQKAVATNLLWRDVYYQSQGSDRHEFWRMEILKSYILKLQMHSGGEGEKTS